jgi:hypothetical protein
MIVQNEAGRNLVCIHAHSADNVHNLIKEPRFAVLKFREVYGKTTLSVKPFLTLDDTIKTKEGKARATVLPITDLKPQKLK